MDTPKFSVVVWAADTNEMYFRDFLESLEAQSYDHWELLILDENAHGRLQRIADEFFPEGGRLCYRSLQNHKGQAYGYNMGFHFGSGDYFVFVGQHDRLSANALYALAAHITENPAPGLIYSDHDELRGADRVHPHFKPDLNRELLLRRNYIGNFLVIAREAAAGLGGFREKLSYAFVYEYYLRAMGRYPIDHISSLLYHERDLADVIVNAPSFAQAAGADSAKLRRLKRSYEEAAGRECRAALQAYLLRENITAQVGAGSTRRGWELSYPGGSYRRHRREYMMLRDPEVRVLTAKAKEKMYGFLQQPKVAVVGAAFLGPGFTYDNVGYIFDKEGIAYPAFHRQSVLRESYEQLAQCPRDVSMVDFGYCMLDAKVYRKLQGLDTALFGRDVMLDYCLRVAEAGYRVVVTPEVRARYKQRRSESSQESNAHLRDKHQELLLRQDPFYNRNLPMGLENYRLPG